MVEFDVLLRGYDRFAVDALMQEIDAAGGDREAIGAAIDRAGRLPIVLRGYAPAEVDAWLARCRTGEPAIAPGSRVFAPDLPVVLRGFRIAETDSLLAVVAAAFDGGDAARAAALRAITETSLPVGFRGYDRGMVDAYLQRAAQALRAP